MGRIDCSLTLNYVAEKNRMCKSERDKNTLHVCSETCPLFSTEHKSVVGSSCSKVHLITQEKINIVQKWSDEHPVRDFNKELYALKVVKKWEAEMAGENNG